MHDELSGRIISATPVTEGGGRHSAALNQGERVGGETEKRTQRERESNTHTLRNEGKEKESVRSAGWIFFQSTDVGTLLRAGSGAEFVRQQHALSPLRDWDLCQE